MGFGKNAFFFRTGKIKTNSFVYERECPTRSPSRIGHSNTTFRMVNRLPEEKASISENSKIIVFDPF